MSNKLRTKTQLDFNQYDAETFDSELQARRVILVGGENLTINADVKSGGSVEYKTIEVPVIVKEIQKVEIPVIVTEYKTIEVPVIVKEIEIREIEKQVVLTEYKVIEVPTVVIKPEVVFVDKPIVQYKEILKVPNWAYGCMILQASALIGLLIKFIK